MTDTSASGAPATSVSTHILDTSAGRPAAGVPVELSVRASPRSDWAPHGTSETDADGRCKDLPALPAATTHVRLHFDVQPYLTRETRETRETSGSRDTHTSRAEAQQDAPRVRDSGAFFPEVAVVFAVAPGEHYHVPLLLNPFGYSVYRGS
ncbi:hydroxyisourate hydrolase [Streptomyces sp. CA-111067]|uniref:hydroxyisourate hydrolase n=1 Tax=Streptomyces sp. CA-111067 TaxID=3240046 RepID=UPI003D96D37B